MKPKIILTFLIFIFLNVYNFAAIRYVSKTGTSTPPYITWETASDSIQKAINICNDGDTVVVANGVYKETLVIENEITMLGSSMDSCIIDGTGLEIRTIQGFSNLNIEGFHITGKSRESNTFCVSNIFHNTNIKNCKISKAESGLSIGRSSGIIENVYMYDIASGVLSFCGSDTCQPMIINTVIITDNSSYPAIEIFDGGMPVIENNIILGNNTSSSGILVGFSAKTNTIRNNLISGFNFNINNENVEDTSVIFNNITTRTTFDNVNRTSIRVGSKSNVRNNIITRSNRGVSGNSQVDINYNLFWKNNTNTYGGIEPGENDLETDPMFINDSVSVDMHFDFHLQRYSPAIDSGDPSILDVDGSRSDIGIFGGPLGQKYTYQDLAPCNPQNVIAVFENGLINLKWNKNSEADLYLYRIYGDTIPDFIYDTTKIIAVTADTFYNDNTSNFMASSYYYKVTAIDSAYNQSPASEEIKIIVTGLGEMPPQVIEDYKLMQNYPNPFNPSTKITYRLKEPGYVKLMVYNILGEIVKVLVNEYQEKGYYEAEFTSENEYLESTKGIFN